MRNLFIYAVLVGAASMQMLGDVLGSAKLKGLGAALAMAPAMKVFTAHEGFETYSSRFYIDWVFDGEERTMQLTPATYGKLRGPYNRRNAYGAALAYGPVLAAGEHTRPMHGAVMHYALCDPGPVIRELGIPAHANSITVRLDPLDPASRDPRWQLDYTISCGESS